MRIFELTANYELRSSRKSHLRDHPKVSDFPIPSRDVTNQTLPGRELFHYSRLGMGKSLTFFSGVPGEVLQICNGLNADPGLAIYLNADPDPVPGPGFGHPTDSIFIGFYLYLLAITELDHRVVPYKKLPPPPQVKQMTKNREKHINNFPHETAGEPPESTFSQPIHTFTI
jgi:hypothetical protein